MDTQQDETAVWEAAADALAGPGIIVMPRFMPEADTNALREAALQLQAAGLFRQAGIGHKQGAVVDTQVRGDTILWLKDLPAAQTPPAVAAFTARIERLIGFLNRALYTGIRSHELHFALYPAGAGYHRHLDVFRDDSARSLTLICYLNPPDWTDADGGHLRVFRPQHSDLPWPFAADFHDVLPAAGTLVLFRSAIFPHEVLPASRTRASLTGWLRTD